MQYAHVNGNENSKTVLITAACMDAK